MKKLKCSKFITIRTAPEQLCGSQSIHFAPGRTGFNDHVQPYKRLLKRYSQLPCFVLSMKEIMLKKAGKFACFALERSLHFYEADRRWVRAVHLQWKPVYLNVSKQNELTCMSQKNLVQMKTMIWALQSLKLFI